METWHRRIFNQLATSVFVALVVGIGVRASAQGCVSCCGTPCCAATSSQTAYCSNNNPSCNGSISFNVCVFYGLNYTWIEDPSFCCGIEFCSLNFSGNLCGTQIARRMNRDTKGSYGERAGGWPLFVLDCAGKYELLEPVT